MESTTSGDVFCYTVLYAPSRTFFRFVTAKIWNALPDNVVSVSSVDSFRHQLKTFFGFQRSFS